jgi:hypothetical protein
MDESKDFPSTTEQNSVQPEKNHGGDLGNRRDLGRNLGRFAAYVAPITVLLLTDKAKAFSGPP